MILYTYADLFAVVVAIANIGQPLILLNLLDFGITRTELTSQPSLTRQIWSVSSLSESM